jgi:hypothetical protein
MGLALVIYMFTGHGTFALLKEQWHRLSGMMLIQSYTIFTTLLLQYLFDLRILFPLLLNQRDLL